MINNVITSNTIAIGLSQFDGLFTNQSVYLRELLPGGGYAYYDIKAAPYQFTITADIPTDESRFALVFVNPTSKTAAPQNDFSVRLAPNPFIDGFQLSLDKVVTGMVKVQLYDVLGKLLEEGWYDSQELSNYLFGKGLSSGMYHAVITYQGHKQTVKAIKN